MKKIMLNFSFTRWLGMMIKEFHELRRDKVSVAMVVLTPLFQLVIFGLRHQYGSAQCPDGAAEL